MELLLREMTDSPSDGMKDAFGGSSLFGELYGLDPTRCKIAVQRINAIHAHYSSSILYRDMLYVLSVFCCTPPEVRILPLPLPPYL